MSERFTDKKSIVSRIIGTLYSGSQSQLRADWEHWRQQSGITAIFTPNPEQVVQAHHNSAFQTVLLSADVLLADGVGLVWAAKKLLPNTKIERFSGRKIVQWWLQEAQQRQISTFLLGSKPGVAQALAQHVDPKQQWCFASEGYHNIAVPTVKEKDDIFRLIEVRKPEVMFVAFGAPWQEMWISENKGELQKRGVKIVMVCGGAIDTLSPATPISAPPRLVEKLQMEWFFRLVQEPWRWRRQMRLVEFIKLVMTEKSGVSDRSG